MLTPYIIFSIIKNRKSYKLKNFDFFLERKHKSKILQNICNFKKKIVEEN